MTYKVELIHSDEGYTVACPEFPGCFSEGQTEEEAIVNFKSTIAEYLSVVRETGSTVEGTKKIVFIDIPELDTVRTIRARKPFIVKPIPVGLPQNYNYDKISSLLEEIEGSLDG